LLCRTVRLSTADVPSTHHAITPLPRSHLSLITVLCYIRVVYTLDTVWLARSGTGRTADTFWVPPTEVTLQTVLGLDLPSWLQNSYLLLVHLTALYLLLVHLTALYLLLVHLTALYLLLVHLTALYLLLVNLTALFLTKYNSSYHITGGHLGEACVTRDG